jgi:O-antigen ligase
VNDSRSDTLAAIGIVVLIMSLIVSSFTGIANAMVVVGVSCLLPSMWRARLRFAAVVSAATALGWVLFGMLVGSTPSWGNPTEVLDWLSEDARFIVTVAVVIGMCGISDSTRFHQAVRFSVAAIALSNALVLVLYPVTNAVRNGEQRASDLLVGVTSSHHVLAALSAFGILAGFSMRDIWSREWLRWIATAVMLAALALSGSRAVLAGLAFALIVLALLQRPAVRYRSTATLLAIVVAVGSFAVPRVSESFDWLFSRNEVPSDEPTLSVENIESRLLYWERAGGWIRDSPAIGGGSFRFNDRDLTFVGVRGVAYLATDGERRFNAGQAHNVYLHVAAETGLIGSVAFFAPWGWAIWVLVRRRPRPGSKNPLPVSTTFVGIREFGVSMAVLASVVGMVSEGVFAPSTGIGAAVAVIGGANLWMRQE